MFVLGVSPGKWTRIWRERMPRHPLEVMPATGAEALEAVRDGSAHMAFLRDVAADADLHVIPVYRERPVVVAARDSAIATLESVTLADLAGYPHLEGRDAETIELIAASDSVAIMPQSVARALSRRDVIARPVSDAAETTIGLAWLAASQHHFIDSYIGIVRGRTRNSSR